MNRFDLSESDASFEADADHERDLEQERLISFATRRRVLDARGSVRMRFEPDAPTATLDALDALRRAGLL